MPATSDAHRPEAQHLRAAGVGRDQPADRRAAPRAERQREAHALALRPPRADRRGSRPPRRPPVPAAGSIERIRFIRRSDRISADPSAGGVAPPTIEVLPPCGTSAHAEFAARGRPRTARSSVVSRRDDRRRLRHETARASRSARARCRVGVGDDRLAAQPPRAAASIKRGLRRRHGRAASMATPRRQFIRRSTFGLPRRASMPHPTAPSLLLLAARHAASAPVRGSRRPGRGDGQVSITGRIMIRVRSSAPAAPPRCRAAGSEEESQAAQMHRRQPARRRDRHGTDSVDLVLNGGTSACARKLDDDCAALDYYCGLLPQDRRRRPGLRAAATRSARDRAMSCPIGKFKRACAVAARAPALSP